MSEWYDSQKRPSSNFRELLRNYLDQNNLRQNELTRHETTKLAKLEAIAAKLRCGENVQNRQLQTWLSEEEYELLEYEWKEQLELCSELKDKPSDFETNSVDTEAIGLNEMPQNGSESQVSICSFV